MLMVSESDSVNVSKSNVFWQGKGAFALTGTETDTDKMATVPSGIAVPIEYEHLHTIPHKLFFIGLGIALCQCEHTATLNSW